MHIYIRDQQHNDPQFAEDANMQDKRKVHKLTLFWLPADSTFQLNGRMGIWHLRFWKTQASLKSRADHNGLLLYSISIMA
jgi:hypothetical protein